jgi:hypothetical protein
VASSVVEENKKNQGSEGDKEKGQSAPGTGRHQLVQRLLDSSASLPAFINDLLTTQAVTVAGTEAAGFLLERQGADQANLRPIAHIRPDQSAPEVRAQAIAAFQDLIKPCVEQGRDGAIEVAPSADGQEGQFCLITLLRAEGEIVAVSAVITRCINVERARQRLMSMQLVAGYFELFTLRRNSDQARTIAQSHQHVLQLATSVATAEGFESAGMNLCNELATRAHATRVSVGWVKGTKIKVVAISHTEQFDKKQELVVQLQKVMEECMDQEGVVQFDPGGKSTDNVTRDAAALSRTQGGHIVLSLPLRRKAEVIGVVTLEFLPQQKIGPQVANGLAIAVDLLAPQLFDRYENDRYLVTKAGISAKKVGGAIIGPKHMIAKLVTVAVIAAALFVTFYSPMHRVSAPFQFISTAKYTLIAPKDGFIADVAMVPDPTTKQPRRIKPGDAVTKGQWLVKFDTRELEIQRARAYSEMETASSQASDARGQDKMAEATIAEHRARTSKAQVDLYDLQIEQAVIKSPADGFVLKGDLEDRVHDRFTFQKDQELMVVGRIDELKAELSVAERDVQFLKLAQHGQVATTSQPGERYDVTVERIVPMSNADPKAADNTFKVYCTLKQPMTTWRPGMAGEARIDIEEKPLYWILSHRLVEYLKLKLWF